MGSIHPSLQPSSAACTIYLSTPSLAFRLSFATFFPTRYLPDARFLIPSLPQSSYRNPPFLRHPSSFLPIRSSLSRVPLLLHALRCHHRSLVIIIHRHHSSTVSSSFPFFFFFFLFKAQPPHFFSDLDTVCLLVCNGSQPHSQTSFFWLCFLSISTSVLSIVYTRTTYPFHFIEIQEDGTEFCQVSSSAPVCCLYVIRLDIGLDWPAFFQSAFPSRPFPALCSLASNPPHRSPSLSRFLSSLGACSSSILKGSGALATVAHHYPFPMPPFSPPVFPSYRHPRRKTATDFTHKKKEYLRSIT